MPTTGERIVLNPRTESALNAPLELVERDGADVRGISLLEHDYPAPEPDLTTASSADSEGDAAVQNRYPNRGIDVTLRVAEPQDAAATNLVVDPGFAIDPTLWAANGSATIARSTAAARDGDYGLAIQAASSTSGAISPAGAAAWACAASKTYTAAVYVRATAAAHVGKLVRLRLTEVTNAGATVGTTDSSTVTLTADWQRVTVTRAFGATGVRYQLTICMVDGGVLVRNLVTNPSAETTAIPNWYDATGLASRVSTQARFGTYSMEHDPAGGWNVVGLNTDLAMTLEPYSAAVWVRVTDAGNYRLDVRNDSSSWEEAGPVVALAANTWTRLVCENFTPGNTDPLIIGLLRDDTNHVAGHKTWMDGLMVVKGATIADLEYVDGSQPGCVWDGTAHASASRQIARVNRIPNPSFGADTGGWQSYGTQPLTRYLDDAGNYVGRVTGAGPTAAGYGGVGFLVFNPYVPITGGCEYTFRATLRIVDAWTPGSNPYFMARFFDSSDAEITTINKGSAPGGTGTFDIDWTVTAPANASKMTVFIIADGTGPFAADTMDWRLDNAQLIAGSSIPEDYWDGSTPDRDDAVVAWSGTAHASPSIRYTTTNFDADQVQFIEEATASNYFDGDTPGCSWTGTLGQSTSSRPAPGGPRFYAILGDLAKVVDQFNREGGTYKRVVPDGGPITFDVLSAKIALSSDRAFIHSKRTEFVLTLTAKPFGRGAEVVGGNNDESTLPCLRFTVAGVPGDVPAIGRLIYTERQAQDQFRLIWGERSRYYSASADRALFYEAEGRTVLGGGSTPASGTASGGNYALSPTITAQGFQAILSTQATGGGNHLAHTGSYRVLARVWGKVDSQSVELAFDYSDGDLVRRVRSPKTFAPRNPSSSGPIWELADFGVVRLKRGRWEGRVLARRSSTVAASVQAGVDCLFLVPVAEGAGEVTCVPNLAAPSSYVFQDTAGRAAANLSGQTPDTGSNWTGAGDGDDFTTNGSTVGTIQRTVGGDDSLGAGFMTGRYDWSPTSAMTGKVVQADVLPGGGRGGVLARVVDASNCLVVTLSSNGALEFFLGVGGSSVLQGSRTLGSLPASTWYTLTVYVDAAGRFFIYCNLQGAGLGTPLLSGQHSALATGGALASGHAGIFAQQDALSGTQQWDNIRAWSIATDAAVYASRQLEIQDDEVIRQDSGGVAYGAPSYTGDYLRVPPAGPENRTTEFIVIPTRGNPDANAIDDMRAVLAYTPRYLIVPS